MRKTVLLFPVFLLAVHLFQLFFLHFEGKVRPRSFTHGFHSSYIQEVSDLDFSQLDTILHQPFHKLGHGKQMTALISQDQKYVLKLFNPMRPLQNRWFTKWKYWKRYSSLKWIKREWFEKRRRLKDLFLRHKLAYELLREETGLLFAHLQPSNCIDHCITVINNKGKEIQISLANTPFILQKKADLVPVYLNSLAKEEAKEAILQIENLLQKRLSVGITDRIQTMENNYGFVDKKPIQIDVGRIRTAEELDINEERSRILHNFHTWVTANYGHLVH